MPTTATIFSSINALTLSPALCGILMRPSKKTRNPIYLGFNWFMDKTTAGYSKVVNLFVRKFVIAIVVFGGICFGAYYGFVSTPGAFVPGEDQGYGMIDIQLPDAASKGRTDEVVTRVEKILKETPGLKNYVSISGYSLINQAFAGNLAGFIIVFEHWNDRPPEQVGSRIVAHVNAELAKMKDMVGMAFETPPMFEMLTWSQLGFHSKPIGLVNVEGYFDLLLAFLDHMVEERFVKQIHRNLLLMERDPEVLLDRMLAYEPPVVDKWLDLKRS